MSTVAAYARSVPAALTGTSDAARARTRAARLAYADRVGLECFDRDGRAAERVDSQRRRDADHPVVTGRGTAHRETVGELRDLELPGMPGRGVLLAVVDGVGRARGDLRREVVRRRP